MNNTFDSRIQPIDNPYLGTTQQKRQSSLSSQMVNPSNKRIPNPLQTPLGMQQPNQDTYQFNTNNSTINSPLTPQVTSPRYNIRTRKNIVQHMKTPTPSAYEVPSSPNVNQLSHLSNQNHSDSSDSNPVLDHTNQDPNQTHHIQQQQQQQQQSYSHQQHQPQQQQQQPIPPQQQPPQQQQQQQARTMSDEEQQLATKLKETYKNIVNFEEVVQKNCIEITMKINQLTSSNNPSLVYGSPMVNQNLSSSLNSNSSLTSNSNRTSELSNDLWTVYHHNITLLDNYYDFLVTSLKPSSNQTQFKTGKNIVELYKIPRRMWVYGIVGFLEVLKNIMGIFQDHEICSCFISYCFNFISNLTDPVLEMEGWWSEKLGDLSRMAIALYASKFIDWKISAEYWYSVAMKTLYGHGKIYYHMCTVQQDNLDALVNIGKSVICRDPFVPTQHYLRLVVENICTQRNILSLLELPIIDFIKIHKVLLSIHNGRNDQSSSTSSPSDIHDSQLQYGIDLVTRYGLTFGSDSNGYNFFTRELYAPGGVSSVNDPSTSQYYQQQSQVQAQSSLPQQMQQPPPSATNTIEKMNFWFNKGSLFAISNINHLIGFGDAKNPFAKLFQLPEALKERKDKKDRKRKSRSASQSEEPNLNTTMGSGGVDGQSIVAADLSANDWFYCLQFINKSVLELSMRILNHYLIGPKQASTAHVIVWLYFLISVGEGVQKYPASKPMVNWLLRHLFPWESLINYLNSLLAFVKNSPKLCAMYTHYLQIENYIDYFNQNEFLPEVWKCWGTLWFDLIAEKSDYIDLKEAGVKNNNLFDLPICGTYPVISNTTGDNFDMKSRNQMENDNDERIIRIILLARTIADNYGFGLTRTTSEFKFDENVYFQIINDINGKEFIADNRFQQNNFIQPISSENLTSETNNNLTSIQKDEVWFGGFDSHLYDDENIELGEDIIDIEDDLEEYPDNVYGRTTTNGGGFNTGVPGNDLYTDSFIGTPTDLGDNEDYEGNFGDKIDSNVTHITLDTNIWLKHCGRIFKCVRNGVIKVSIPLIVFQELRALRKSSEATIADAATRSVIIVRELYLAREIVPLRFDGTVASDINETAEFENNSTWRSNVDETILHSVNEHDEMGKRLMKGLNLRLSSGDDEYSRKVEPPVLNSRLAKLFKYCILVTDDRNMRLRAKTIGLTSFHSKWLFTQLETVFPDRCID
ncbi:ESL1 EST/SMG-like protein 1 [Candida maltosa Xu316]